MDPTKPVDVEGLNLFQSSLLDGPINEKDARRLYGGLHPQRQSLLDLDLPYEANKYSNALDDALLTSATPTGSNGVAINGQTKRGLGLEDMQGVKVETENLIDLDEETAKIGGLNAPVNPRRKIAQPRKPSARLHNSESAFAPIPRSSPYLASGPYYREYHRNNSGWYTFRDWDMADADERGFVRRGGYNGGGGGGGNKKRRFREDDDYARQPQRRRQEETPWRRVRRAILSIAESPLRRPEDDVLNVAKDIAENYEDTSFTENVTDLIPQLVIEQPFKIPFVAAILLHIQSQKPELVKQILDKVALSINSLLEQGQWRSVKLLLRFLACINGMFEGEDIFAVLEELFGRAVDLQTASPEDTVGLELVRIIMLTLPYAKASTDTNFAEKAASIMEKTEIIASAPHPTVDLVTPYHNADGETTDPKSPSVLVLLQQQLQAEAEKGWELSFMPKPFQKNVAPTEPNGDEPASKQQFPTISIPRDINPGPQPLFPEVYFSLYADQDIETVPPTSNLASSVIRDALVDTINVLDFNRNAAAKYLVEMDCYWAPDSFVKRATPFDKVKDVAGEIGSTWKTEDLAVDAIFSQMLLLPIPEHKVVYFHSMITETCKIAPAAIAPSLGRAIRYLYRNIEVMDLELNYRFMDWFSHHLSNFDFRWKWVEWVDDVTLSPLHPKKAFILGALDKEVRLSFARRIRETLPEPYHVLIPATRDNDIPDFKFKPETFSYSTEAKQIVQLLRKKSPNAEFQPIFDTIRSAEVERVADMSTPPDPLLASTDAFVTSLCYIGSKSLSHVLSYIERHREYLLGLGGPASDTSPAVKAQMIDSVVSYWKNTQAGVAVNIIDKLLNYTIVQPATVLSWALSDQATLDAGRALAETYLYEMVSGTLGKVTARVRQIVAARAQSGLPAPQIAVLDETLTRERDGMRALFATVEDALVGVAMGANERMVADGVEEEELAFLKGWGARWLRVFRRKSRVEEMRLAEALRTFPPPAEEVDADMEGGDVDLVIE